MDVEGAPVEIISFRTFEDLKTSKDLKDWHLSKYYERSLKDVCITMSAKSY